MPQRPVVLITRAEKDAKQLIDSLPGTGIECFTEPLFSIDVVNENQIFLQNSLKFPLQAILVTSRNAIDSFAAMTARRDFPLVTVGSESACHAVKCGFKQVEYANGDAAALLEWVERHYSPRKGDFLYARGAVISLDIAAHLAGKGFCVNEVIVYKSTAVENFSLELQTFIKEKNITAVTFYSRNTAALYNSLVEKHRLAEYHNGMIAICISQKVAEESTKLPWKKIMIAETKDNKGVMDILRNFMPPRTQ